MQIKKINNIEKLEEFYQKFHLNNRKCPHNNSPFCPCEEIILLNTKGLCGGGIYEKVEV